MADIEKEDILNGLRLAATHVKKKITNDDLIKSAQLHWREFKGNIPASAYQSAVERWMAQPIDRFTMPSTIDLRSFMTDRDLRPAPVDHFVKPSGEFAAKHLEFWHKRAAGVSLDDRLSDNRPSRRHTCRVGAVDNYGNAKASDEPCKRCTETAFRKLEIMAELAQLPKPKPESPRRSCRCDGSGWIDVAPLELLSVEYEKREVTPCPECNQVWAGLAGM